MKTEAQAKKKGPAATPSHLFIDYWCECSALTASQRSSAARADDAFVNTARQIASIADPVLAVDGLNALVAKHRDGSVCAKLGVMRAIDLLFARLHPRVPRHDAPPLPAWVKLQADYRVLHGAFVKQDGIALVPCGPLLRTARDPYASSADSLADRFSYLSVVPLTLMDRDTPISVRISCFGMGLLDGVVPLATPGSERIAFVPLAESIDDLDIRPVELNGRPFVTYRPSSGLDATTRFMSAIAAAGEHDMAVAPELVMSSEHSTAICAALRQASATPRVLLLGTENTVDTENEQPFNEAVVVNTMGYVLCRQRKIWPASIDAARAYQLGLSSEENGEPILENNASGRELQITDIDGFGRILVLICQDIQLSAAAELVERFQPDWVLMPILDLDLASGRWAHRRALSLSANAQSRFVAVTSVSLGLRFGNEGSGAGTIGMAIGPAHPESIDDKGRAAAFILSTSTGSPALGTIQWRGPGWVTSKIVAE